MKESFKKVRIFKKKNNKIHDLKLTKLLEARNKISNNHMGKHHDDNKEECLKCGLIVASETSLMEHMVEHHDEQLMICKDCDFKEISIKQLKEHLNKNHQIKWRVLNRFKLKKIQEVEKMIAEAESEMNIDKIMKHFQTFSSNPENVNLQQVWKVMNKLWPKVEPKIPTGKKNLVGFWSQSLIK